MSEKKKSNRPIRKPQLDAIRRANATRNRLKDGKMQSSSTSAVPHSELDLTRQMRRDLEAKKPAQTTRKLGELAISNTEAEPSYSLGDEIQSSQDVTRDEA